MKSYARLLCLAALFSQSVHAQISNGSFESFTGNTPDGWTTIDSGITTAPSATAQAGAQSVSISVNTASQAATDFRQSVAVVAGQNYDFSVWVYHTEGHVRARLYVDGYQGYSSETTVNQWQQLSYSYTAASSTDIEVGLRFYDVTGFDGSEVVYVDSFQPSTSSGGGCSGSEAVVDLTTDSYASETSWEILDGSSQVTASGSGYANNSSYSESLCLADGDYTFVIYDSYGDGICCSYGSGSYALTVAGETIASGGEFSGEEATPFSLPSASSEPPSGCASNLLELVLLTDNYGSETSWQLLQGTTTLGTGSGYTANTLYNESFCLADNSYTFVISDSYGDGICCSVGNGSYRLTSNGITIAEGGEFTSSESINFDLPAVSGGGGSGGYYDAAAGLSGYALKTALYNIIKDHNNQGYSALWGFYSANELDHYYENDGSILDIYSENPSGSDPYNYTPVSNQCGTYNSEADCYNREHSFPRNWFGGQVEPMNSDVHHIFATDGQVNAYRSSYPYGEVGTATTTSSNGSKLGSAAVGLGYSGTVFEPIDEFKGDLARAYFYMATRYQNQIAGWQSNAAEADAVLNGTSDQVFEPWMLTLLKSWHNQDPVSQKEIDRNEAVYQYQGNRNPFVDHPEWVTTIWGN
ncbi:endonuclease [Halioxenophilus sp. WMMB6]|uniref:endonuclease n=1 Tax=Halioxenophilus sp. WMMB6 TaxID=3073815 RepID=UPI00295F46C9|nr:endonuclease [Halioxenophilus sp. WMMB6]